MPSEVTFPDRINNRIVNREETQAQDLRVPFLLSPAGQDYLWGGRRLRDDFGKTGAALDRLEPLAETWECSTHPDGTSTVASGPFIGRSLSDYIAEYPQVMGSHPLSLGLPKGQLPILVKFIDADRDLSVQVHPDDDFAAEHENGALGKTEMWYVLDAAKGAQLIYGFNRNVDAGLVRKALQSDSIEKMLRKVAIQKDDVYYIECGTVHAIGAGSLIVEVQENSNITYRLYDYHRTDKNGKERTLHVEKALQVANLNGSAAPRQPIRVLNYRQGNASELLCRCRYFQAERLIVNTERHQLAEIKADQASFLVLVCTDGCGTMLWETEGVELSRQQLLFYKGDTIFIPADSVDIRIHGNAKFLKVHC